MFRFLKFLLFGTVLFAAPAAGDEATIQRAIDAYTTAMNTSEQDARLRGFQKSEQLFRQVTEGTDGDSGIQNANLFINLGNAALQGERIGPAIVAFRKALVLEPNNLNAKQNLDFARSMVPEWIRVESESGFVDSFFFWTSSASPLFLSLSAAVCFAIGIVMFCLGVLRKLSLLRSLSLLPMLLWLVLLAAFVNKTSADTGSELVLIDEATLFSADSENSSPRIAKLLPGGAEVELIQDRDRWIEIQIPGNISGWVLRSTVEQINTE